jgi:hypothetical protein
MGRQGFAVAAFLASGSEPLSKDPGRGERSLRPIFSSYLSSVQRFSLDISRLSANVDSGTRRRRAAARLARGIGQRILRAGEGRGSHPPSDAERVEPMQETLLCRFQEIDNEARKTQNPGGGDRLAVTDPGL